MTTTGHPQNILLSITSFPPIQYFVRLLLHEKIYIEQHENFIKQTYRNRYYIPAANGVIALVIPVVKGRGRKTLIKDLKISYDTNWQRTHWRTIFSAFNSSPFFEYYMDDIHPFFEKHYDYLLDYNLEVLDSLSTLIELDFKVNLTTDFEAVPADTLNFREAITPKSKNEYKDHSFNPETYTQVFSDKYGFTPNVSILDLLFNEGPNSINILNKSMI